MKKRNVWEQPELEYFTFCEELRNEPHVLIGGTTGSGKSVLLDDFIWSLASYSPSSEQLVLIDLKRVELIKWWGLPHVIDQVTEPEDILPCLDWLIGIMDDRYRRMMDARTNHLNCSHIHVIIDEANEVFRIKGAKDRIDKLMRLARASRIHIVMATQNISRNQQYGIPSYIYINVSCTVGLRCKSAIESRQIIGVPGCEELPRYGQCIISSANGLIRQKVPMLTDEQIEERIKAYNGYPL